MEARYWHTIDEDRVQCDVCPRLCRLHEGQRGLCFVRMNHGGRLLLDTYGRSSGFCIDPIEKKPLNHFLPGSAVLSFGTAGCNLTCRFCQNWDISKSRETDTLCDEASPDAIAETALRHGCSSVAYTYNDPVVFLEYAVDVAAACRQRDIRNVAVTAGYISTDAREEFFSSMDAANVDLKAFTQDFYHDVCGGDLETVLDTLLYIRQHTSVWLELTNLVIPGLNDTDDEIDRMTRWIARMLGADTPLHFTAFHPDHRMRDRSATPVITLRRARDIGRKNGLRHVYTGNVGDTDGSRTLCHGCGNPIITREGYDITDWALDSSAACRVCGTLCAGVFTATPGRWGSRRQPLHIGLF